MDNIHAPTVPSGPSSRQAVNGNATQLSFAELSARKENMEAELKALSGVLDSVSVYEPLGPAHCAYILAQHGVNMETPLTRDGFPRADIDVAQSMQLFAPQF
jgi:26S proteasome regulatory subunit N4